MLDRLKTLEWVKESIEKALSQEEYVDLIYAFLREVDTEIKKENESLEQAAKDMFTDFLGVDYEKSLDELTIIKKDKEV